MSRKSVNVWTGTIGSLDEGTVSACVPLVSATNSPYTIMNTISPMNVYVGPEKTAPDSLTPRRLPTASSATKNSAMRDRPRQQLRERRGDRRRARCDIDTATVST